MKSTGILKLAYFFASYEKQVEQYPLRLPMPVHFRFFSLQILVT